MSPARPVSSTLPVPFDFSTEPRKETEGLMEGDFFQRGTLFRKAVLRGSGVRISVAFVSTIFNPSCIKKMLKVNQNTLPNGYENMKNNSS
jgi:hypothetical protein